MSEIPINIATIHKLAVNPTQYPYKIDTRSVKAFWENQLAILNRKERVLGISLVDYINYV